MEKSTIAEVVDQVAKLVNSSYVFPEDAIKISGVLVGGLARGRYASITDAQELAVAVSEDLQSVNGDKHLRLLYHVDPLAERVSGDDSEEYAAMAGWADRTGGGVATVRRLAGNVGYLDLQPLLFPTVISGDVITAAMSLVAPGEALIIDLSRCLGGEPTMVAFICSYLWNHEPVELTGLYERKNDRIKQSWTVPYVPGRRFGATKPVYVLTSATTFSGGEALSYDLQQLGRATVIGEQTRGGAHAREGFRVHPHLEATISVARSVNPTTGGNWEGTGVTPDVRVPAAEAPATAYRLALEHVLTLDAAWTHRETIAEAQEALADLDAKGTPLLTSAL